MRDGSLHPANLWLAARIPPYHTCFAEVHAAAELAFSEKIPQAHPPFDDDDRWAYGFAFRHLFYFDMADEADAGKKIPAKRVLYRAKALVWVMRYVEARGVFEYDPLTYEEAAAMIDNVSLWPPNSSVRLDSYNRLCNRVATGVNHLMLVEGARGWTRFMGDLQRYLLA
jgi:hypothetical protein